MWGGEKVYLLDITFNFHFLPLAVKPDPEPLLLSLTKQHIQPHFRMFGKAVTSYRFAIADYLFRVFLTTGRYTKSKIMLVCMEDASFIEDLVVLGRAAPEPISDGRHTVCLGGYSETLGFVRLYPTQRRMAQCKRWNVISVPVESAEPDDTRDESYKIAGSRESWDRLHTKIEKVGRLSKPERIQLVERLAGDCTGRLNDQHKSLGIAKPQRIHDVYLKDQEDPTYQVTLNGRRRQGKREYPQKLYLRYECEECSLQGPHNQHCIEWGIYRYWDKNDDPKGVIDALRLTDDAYQHYFFVGNLNHRRHAYIIISDLRFKWSDMRKAGIRGPEQSSLF